MAAEPPASVLLLQFARAPAVGRVKTRMMPHLTARQACDLHCELVLWASRQLVASGLGDVELWTTGDANHPLFKRCQELGVAAVSQQTGADLGERMYRALRAGLARYDKVILVGSDCPGLNGTYLKRAVAGLDTVPVVVGPATDGGYVLIGARQVDRALFQGISWGSAQVYRETTEALQRSGMGWLALDVLQDVDRPDDLAAWEALKPGTG